MIKLLFIGDRHNSQTIPSCRVDDFFDSCDKKDKEIIKIAQDNEVDAVIQPGDFWTDSDHRLKNDFISTVSNKWKHMTTVSGKHIPLIGIAGNHDLIGENLGQLASSTVGLLDSLDVFPIITRANPYVITDGKKKVVITGVNYHKGMDKPENIDDYIEKEHLGDVHIHIVHGMLSPSNLGKMIRHTQIEKIAETKADITLCGHDHNGFGIVEYNNKYFVNPGAVVRLSANEKEIKRTIQVALITIDNDINIELIPLKSALPGNVVIDRTQLDHQAELSKYTEVLKESVQHMDIGNSVGMEDILEEIFKEQKIPEEICKSIQADIKENSEAGRMLAKTVPSDRYIAKVNLSNFQSHANTSIELSKNFNVIVGESRQGKSAIMRALRWVIENKPSGKSFIKIGEDSAFVELILDDGTIIRRFVTKKENGYKIFFPDGKIEEGNTKMVTRVQEILGYCNLKIDDNMSIPLNILRQGNDWYLIGDNYSSTDRARILGSLKNTNAADASIKGYEKENNQLTSSIKKEEVEKANLNLEIEELYGALAEKEALAKAIDCRIIINKVKDLNGLQEDLDVKTLLVNRISGAFNEVNLREKIQELLKLCDKLKSINRHLEIYAAAIKANNRATEILNALPDVESLLEKRKMLQDKMDRKQHVQSLSKKITDSQNVVKTQDKMIKLLSIDEVKVQTLRNMVSRYLNIRLHYTSVIKSQRTIDAANAFIDASTIVESYGVKRQELISLCDKEVRVKTHVKRIRENEESLSKHDKDVKAQDSQLDVLIDKKVHILSDSKVCPTCLSELTESKLAELMPKIRSGVND